MNPLICGPPQYLQLCGHCVISPQNNELDAGCDCFNINYSIILRIFTCRSIKKDSGWMSRLLGVDSGEVICHIFIRLEVKVCAVFQFWVTRSKQIHGTS